MDLGIAGRVAVVTASSKGLGLASARALAGEGAAVVMAARGEEALEKESSALAASGAKVATLVCDVTEPDAADRLVSLALERFGRLDIVVANAGGPPPGRALDLDDAAIKKAVGANLLSSVRLVRSALPHMRQSGWGRCCCIASSSVVQVIPTLALSNTARIGLWGWAKSAAADLAGSGITLNLACPGPHKTERMIELGRAFEGEWGDPADFGRVVAFLCSQPANYINGARVLVDGGSTLAV